MANAAEAANPGEKLSREEIWRRYPNEWVILVDCDWVNCMTTAGVVYGHSPDKKEARRMAKGLRDYGFYWTGEMVSPILWYLTHVRPGL